MSGPGSTVREVRAEKVAEAVANVILDDRRFDPIIRHMDILDLKRKFMEAVLRVLP